MTPDERLFLLLVVSFSALVTAHVSLVVGLALRQPRWRALVALPVFPLAPYWAARSGMRLRAGLWGAAVLAYLAIRVIASH
jgi:hypothetical protein